MQSIPEQVDSETETFTRYRVSYVFHISQDVAGILWLSTPTGLYALDQANGDIDGISTIKRSGSLESNTFKSMVKTERAIWLPPARARFIRSKNWQSYADIPLYEVSYHSLSTKIASECFWIYHVSGDPLAVFDRKTHTLTQFSFHEENSPGPALTGITEC